MNKDTKKAPSLGKEYGAHSKYNNDFMVQQSDNLRKLYQQVKILNTLLETFSYENIRGGDTEFTNNYFMKKVLPDVTESIADVQEGMLEVSNQLCPDD